MSQTNDFTRRDVLKTIGIGTAAIAATGAMAAESAKVGAYANKLLVNAEGAKQKISRHIYGHFAEHLGRCIYEGIWVGPDSPIPNTRGIRNDVVEALKKLNMPNLRWPGGCFADTYHWKDGIGPREKRPCIVNVHWGGVTENNHFGTHEFFDLCGMLGCEPYVCGNVGSGTVQEMAEWLEYITMPGQSPMADLRRKNGRDEPWDITYWAVGNENWGCGGQMRAEYYTDEYRRFQNYCRNFARKPLYKVACGFNEPWNEVLLREAGRMMGGLSVHYYTSIRSRRGSQQSGSATKFAATDWFNTFRRALGIEDFILRTEKIMDQYDPQRRVGIVMDEWGTWFDVEPDTNPGFLYQQNTLRDALVAGLSLNLFNNHANRVFMANIAQTINVLQSMILTDGPRMLRTPTYHVFEMYKVHQEATLLPTTLDCAQYEMGNGKIPQLSASASRDKDGKVHLSLCNLHHEEAADLTCDLRGLNVTAGTGRILTAGEMNIHNTFDKPDTLQPAAFDGFKLARNALTVRLPARSVMMIELA